MDPELKQLMEQMQSLMDEVAMISGEEGYEEETAEKQDDNGLDAIMGKIAAGEPLSEDEQKVLSGALSASKAEEEMDGDESEVDKATASDSAEERVDDVTDISENAQDVVKALKTLTTLMGGGKAQKSNSGATSRSVKKVGSNAGQPAQITQALEAVAKAVQSVNNKVETVGKAVEGIFDALDISDDVIKSELGDTVQKSTKTPKQGGENETAQVLKSILDQINSQGTQSEESSARPKSEVRKDLSGAMKGIFAGGRQ